MFRNAVLAAALALAAGTASAAELVNVGGEQSVIYRGTPPTVVGGAIASISGGGDSRMYMAWPGGFSQAPGQAAWLVGGGDEAQVVYAPARVARR